MDPSKLFDVAGEAGIRIKGGMEFRQAMAEVSQAFNLTEDEYHETARELSRRSHKAREYRKQKALTMGKIPRKIQKEMESMQKKAALAPVVIARQGFLGTIFEQATALEMRRIRYRFETGLFPKQHRKWA